MDNIDLLWDNFKKHFGYKKDDIIKIADFCHKNCKEMEDIVLQTADETARHKFWFRLPWDMEATSEAVNFGKKIIWDYCHKGDEEFIFQLNRHRYWICLGQAYLIKQNDMYANAFIEQLLDWIDENIDIKGDSSPVWRTLETGLRADYWVRAMAFFTSCPLITREIKEKFFHALCVHGKHLAGNLKRGFSIKSNWGVMEYTGLYILSLILDNPEYKDIATGFLKIALHTQIHDDGMQWEASTMYHNEVWASYLEVLRVAGLYGDKPFSDEEKWIIRDMGFATLNHTYPNHHQLMTGDSDDTDVRDLLSQAAVLFREPVFKFAGYKQLDFEGAWLYGVRGMEYYERLKSLQISPGLITCFESGEAIWRESYDENSDFIYFRNGSLGGGHGHQDKLHVELWFCGEEILRDSGRFTYKDVEERYILKGAKAHNVPIINNSEYVECKDSWIYKNLPPSLGNIFIEKDKFLLFEGCHCGYINSGVLLRRRILVIKPDIIIINDDIIGNKNNYLSQHFSFGEDISLKQEGDIITGKGKKCEFLMKSFDEKGATAQNIVNSPVSRHYNHIGESKGLEINTSDSCFLTTIIAKNVMNEKTNIIKEDVFNYAYEALLTSDKAGGYVITRKNECYGAVFIRDDVGNHRDLNGIRGVCGLGQTMATAFHKNPEYMTVLRW